MFRRQAGSFYGTSVKKVVHEQPQEAKSKPKQVFTASSSKKLAVAFVTAPERRIVRNSGITR